MRQSAVLLAVVLSLFASLLHAGAQEVGREIYQQRCSWCHGNEGRGDGPSAVGMFPPPRDLVRADYKIRSTPHGQLPTDDDIFNVISRGFPGTPMEGWNAILDEEDIWNLVSYVKSLSPRFEDEPRNPLDPPPLSQIDVDRGERIYKDAKCTLCHGVAGRGEGEITTRLAFDWGLPHSARDLTRGWTLKGGSEPQEIYLRITGGLNGTPMGPYRDLLSDQDRWALATYVASLDREPLETSEDFVVAAARVDGSLPDSLADPAWEMASVVLVPLAGQVVQDPPSRWWTPTAGSAAIRALWNGTEVGFLLEWNDPTETVGGDILPDSAFLQFGDLNGSKPYFLLGDDNSPVRIWHWQAGDSVEEWTAAGALEIDTHLAAFRATGVWEDGRWHVIFRRSATGEPGFMEGEFVPILISVRDGANGEAGNLRAISTWLYTTIEPTRSLRSVLVFLMFLLGTVIVELSVLARIRR